MGIKGGTFVITVRSFIKCVSFQHCSPHQASFFQNYSSQPIFSRIKSAAPGRASLAASGRSISMQNISADIENNNHSSGFSNRFSNGTNLGNTNIPFFKFLSPTHRVNICPNRQQLLSFINNNKQTGVRSRHPLHQRVLYGELDFL